MGYERSGRHPGLRGLAAAAATPARKRPSRRCAARLDWRDRTNHREVRQCRRSTSASPRRSCATATALTGILRPATWDEALDRAVAGLRAAGAAHGSRTYGVFSCSKSTNEVNFAAQKFSRTVLGSNNIDSCNRT